MARRNKTTEEQMQLFQSGGTPSQKDKADKALSEMDDMLKKGISEEVKKEDGTVISKTYKDPNYAAEDVLRMLQEGKISVEQAEKFLREQKEAGNYAKGGMEDGGLKDEGGSVDPVSGNEVPAGSTQKEVRDDIPAQLSEGEFVFPADVVRYIGLENLMQLRQKAKQGLQKMEDMGQMGNSEEAIMEDDGEYDDEIDNMIDDLEMEEATRSFAVGGYNPPKQSSFSLPDFDPMKNLFPEIQTNTSSTPSYREFMGGPSVPQYETKQFIGPNNEMISITFINGNPVQPIPPGYKEYKGGPIETPEVSPVDTMADMSDNEDSSDDRERKEDQQQQYENYVSSMERLASFDPEFKDYWDNSIQGKANKTKGLEGLKGFNAIKAITEAFETGTKATDAYERIAEQYGLNMDDYTNTGIKGFFDKFDEDKLMTDVIAMEDMGMSNVVVDDVTAEQKRQSRRGLTPTEAEQKSSETGFSRAATEALSDADADVQAAFEDEMQKQQERIEQEKKARDAGEGRDDNDDGLSKGESPTGDDVAGTPFSQGGAVEQTAAMLTPKKKTRGRRPARKK